MTDILTLILFFGAYYAFLRLMLWGVFEGAYFAVKKNYELSKKKIKLFLDDERFPADNTGTWVIVRTHEEFVSAVIQKCPHFISFDHDLGDEDQFGSGMTAAKELIEMDLDGVINLPASFDFQVHSMNPVGAKNIESLLRRYMDHKNA